MYIHWFPGHMTKALREMESAATKVDCLVYVLDARIPLSSINPAYDNIFKNKPRLYVLNKADLVESNDILVWKNYFSTNGNRCIIANSTVKGGTKNFISELKKVSESIVNKYLLKGVKKTVRAMVIGIPNCGKSTLINSLLPQKKANTGNKPGVTRGQQWVSVDPYIDLLDTPGTLYPDFSDQVKATHLAIVGSIKETLFDMVELSMEIISFLKENYPEKLKMKYSFSDIDKISEELLQDIAIKRNYILRGGEIDIERTAKGIVQDFRKGTFGKIILEKR